MDTDEYIIAMSSTANRDIRRIYDYISNELYAEKAAKNLINQAEGEIQKLKYAPRSHIKIEKTDDLQRNYRRIVVKNYVILYTIDDCNKIIYISHMYYGRRNYLNF